MPLNLVDKVRCLRAEMGLCAGPECLHNEPHEAHENEQTKKDCTVYELCKERGIYTRCVPYEN